jgi:hypothetical protein
LGRSYPAAKKDLVSKHPAERHRRPANGSGRKTQSARCATIASTGALRFRSANHVAEWWNDSIIGQPALEERS